MDSGFTFFLYVWISINHFRKSCRIFLYPLIDFLISCEVLGTRVRFICHFLSFMSMNNDNPKERKL